MVLPARVYYVLDKMSAKSGALNAFSFRLLGLVETSPVGLRLCHGRGFRAQGLQTPLLPSQVSP